MVWTMMGPLATEIAESLKATQNFIMSADQSATLVAVPVLAGAILRVVLGFFVDKVGAKKTALTSQLIVVIGLFFAYYNLTHMLLRLFYIQNQKHCNTSLYFRFLNRFHIQ